MEPEPDGLERRPDVSVIVVTFNSAEVVAPSLAPLAASAGHETEILVYDNASNDDTLARVRSIAPRAHVMEGEANIGFARAVNAAAARAHGRYILLLNPDAAISANGIAECLAYLDAHPEIGILSPLVSDPTDVREVSEAGRAPTIWRLLMHYGGLSRFADKVPGLEGLYILSRHLDRTRQVDWVSGACMFIRREAWQALGGMNERWFMYAEDVDLCVRARRAGWEIVVLHDVIADHLMGQSTSEVAQPTVNSAWILHLFDLYRLHYSSSDVHAWLWRFVAILGLRSRSIAFWSLARVGPRRSRTVQRQRALAFRQHARRLAHAPLRLDRSPDQARSAT